jgi:hypothetical protein
MFARRQIRTSEMREIPSWAATAEAGTSQSQS